MLSNTLRAATALALAFQVTLPTAKAETIECRAKPESRGYWSWREIDGRHCWYEGRHRISKELLSWGSKTPAKATKPAEDAKPAKVAKPAEIVKPAEAVKAAEASKPAEAVKPAEAIKLDTTMAPTPPQVSSGGQAGASGAFVEFGEQPIAAASPLGPFEIAWRNAMADLNSQDRPKKVRTITVRPTNAD
jgi:hypothetical protein